jgi:hypothetical protein
VEEDDNDDDNDDDDSRNSHKISPTDSTGFKHENKSVHTTKS